MVCVIHAVGGESETEVESNEKFRQSYRWELFLNLWFIFDSLNEQIYWMQKSMREIVDSVISDAYGMV